MEGYILLVVLFICKTTKAQMPDNVGPMFGTNGTSIFESTILRIITIIGWCIFDYVDIVLNRAFKV